MVDYLAALRDCDKETQRKAVLDVLADAEAVGASRDVCQLLEDTIAGRRVAVDWPWPKLSRLTKALLPGTVTLICGDAGVAKSFFLLEAAAHWHRHGHKLALYELDEDRQYRLYRALAQQTGNSDLFDDSWVRDNPDAAREALERHQGFLDSFGRCIYEAPDKQVSLADLGKWVHERAETGCRIIAVDPVTAASVSDRQWLDDGRFMIEAKAAVRANGASLVLITHPRKGRKGAIGLDELSGGAAYQRFSQSVIWLDRHKVPKVVEVSEACVTYATQINCTVHLSKTRNARGHGLCLAYNFQGASLRFSEEGIIKPKGNTSG